jgi:hypothetical protein
MCYTEEFPLGTVAGDSDSHKAILVGTLTIFVYIRNYHKTFRII